MKLSEAIEQIEMSAKAYDDEGAALVLEELEAFALVLGDYKVHYDPDHSLVIPDEAREKIVGLHPDTGRIAYKIGRLNGNGDPMRFAFGYKDVETRSGGGR